MGKTIGEYTLNEIMNICSTRDDCCGCPFAKKETYSHTPYYGCLIFRVTGGNTVPSRWGRQTARMGTDREGAQ